MSAILNSSLQPCPRNHSKSQREIALLMVDLVTCLENHREALLDLANEPIENIHRKHIEVELKNLAYEMSILNPAYQQYSHEITPETGNSGDWL